LPDTLYDDGLLYDLAHGVRAGSAEVAFYARRAAETGGRCLELGCGTGRVTVPLAESGVPMTGLDLAPDMLAVAKRKGAGLPIDWVAADFRDFSLPEAFGAIIVPINSIAHLLTDEDVTAAFGRVRAHLAPEGRFVFEYFVPNLTLLARHPDRESPVAELTDASGAVTVKLSESNRYDSLTQVNHIWWFCRWADGRVREQYFRMRIFYPRELRALLATHGLVPVGAFVLLLDRRLSVGDRRQLLVCRAL
jgi:SAM-dependent methyltransferase